MSQKWRTLNSVLEFQVNAEQLLFFLSLTALNNGAVVATQVPTLLGLDLLGAPIIGTTPSTFFSITPNQPFNELRLSFGSTIGALGSPQTCANVSAE